ncbi:hypothetical protein KP509_39G028700 [Ceratopteris richardii]|nr:hypothetical protein KP509_39G028700 [Ceratopteris richardii]
MVNSSLTRESIMGWPLWMATKVGNVAASFQFQSHRCISKASVSALQRLNYPVPKIRIKQDRFLDHDAEEEKSIAPLVRIKNMFLMFKKEAIPLQYLTLRRRMLGLRTTEERFEEFVRNYPTLFKIYTHPDEHRPWLRLTADVMKLVEQERRIHASQEHVTVEKLRRLLMLAQGQQIRANRVMLLAPFFGFPDDLITRVVPKYPEYFNLAQHGKPYQTLELIGWDETLAVTELEKKVKMEAQASDLDCAQKRGNPLSFKFQYTLGVIPTKKAISYLEEWQKLPFISPYEDADNIEIGTPLGDRRMVALLHELLSLTIQKKLTIEILNHFHNEFNLPGNIFKAVNRYPGIFYVSVKGALHTLYLREGYERQHLIEECHPLVRLKERFSKMVQNGPRLCRMWKNAKRTARYKVE